MFINQYPQHEFILQQNNQQYQQPEDFTFFDFEDQQKVKCYYPNTTMRPSMKLPRTHWATTPEEKQALLNNLIGDINISTPDIIMTPEYINFPNQNYLQPYQIDQFVEQKIQIFDQNNNELSAQQVSQLAALGQITAKGFKKNQLQKTKDLYARELDIDTLRLERKRQKVSEIKHTLPRLFFYRKNSVGKDQEFLKSRLVENIESFIPIGKFSNKNMIFVTCLPSSEKDRETCDLLKIDSLKGGDERCSRLCQIKDFAQQYYQQFDKDYIVCNKY